MRKAALLIVIVLVHVSALPAHGKSSDGTRTASKPYTGAQAVLVGNAGTPSAYVGDCDPAEDSGCVRFKLGNKDRYFTLAVRDTTGLPVYAVVFSDGIELVDFCGETAEPVRRTTRFIEVWLTYGTCYESPTPSLPTTGVVEATFAPTRGAL